MLDRGDIHELARGAQTRGIEMRIGIVAACAAVAAVAAVASGTAEAQPPSIPPQTILGPELRFELVAQSDTLAVPEEVDLNQAASAAIDADGHVFVLSRGEQPFLEFDRQGQFVRAFGKGLFTRAHSLTIDGAGDFWVTDVSAHVVMKLDRNGRVLMTLGTEGESGAWDEAAGQHLFDEPTDVAIAPNGDVFVTQGHSRGDPRVFKFDANGHFVKTWGGRGSLPWEFVVAHSIDIGADGLVYVADRENRRILVFDTDGTFVKGWVYQGMACSIDLGDDGHIYMTTGFDGQIVELDENGRVVGVTGMPGDGPGEYGEAHDLVASADGAIYVTDVVNRRVTKYARAR
jgi:DNA-binding beta-propeller fold protein YncE